MQRAVVLATCLCTAQAAAAQDAQDFDTEPFYGGAGVAHNSISGADNAGGYQLFGGYAFDIDGMPRATLAAEVGYFESGEFERNNPSANQSSEFDADGLWANAVISYPLSPKWNLLGRAGLDFGDDDGLMAGGGLGYRADRHVELRGEVVARDNIESLQANLVFRF